MSAPNPVVSRRLRFGFPPNVTLGADAYVVVPVARRVALRDWLSRVRRHFGLRSLSVAAGALVALYGLGSAGYLQAKAAVAQVLLRDAFVRTLADGAPAKPWPWADTFPAARLEIGSLGIDQIVLAGASGRTMAFGPALSTGGAVIGNAGVAVISGHRDTHFAFLRRLKVGDRVWLETPQGRYAYRIDRFDVVDAERSRLPTGGDAARLALVTCFPFDAISPGGPLRYVASATLVATEHRA